MILLLNTLSEIKFLNSMGVRSHISRFNDDKVSDPYITVFIFLRWNSDLFLMSKDLIFNLKTSVIISWARLCFTLNILIAKFCRSFWCIVNELPFFSRSVKEELKSLKARQGSFTKCFNSIIRWAAMIHSYLWA